MFNEFLYFQFTTVIYIGLFLFEELDTSLILTGLLANAAFYALLQNFPYFILSSPAFIASVCTYFPTFTILKAKIYWVESNSRIFFPGR